MEGVSDLLVGLPLFTLAGSAVAYLIKIFQDRADQRRKRFFELVGMLDQKGTLAGKLAAVYELSLERKHRDFLIRFFEKNDEMIEGKTADILRSEMNIALERLRKD